MLTPIDTEPFHHGEREIQQRLGVRERMARFGDRVIRDHLPTQHREFFEQLPYVFYGALDAQGQPWASMLSDAPGFIASPDPTTLAIQARPLAGDPVFSALAAGSQIGLLGIDFTSRRRNRANGRLSHLHADGFSVSVIQSFGNCPKYIQTRAHQTRALDDSPNPVERERRFTERYAQLVGVADTFFIATYYAEGTGAANEGVDVSHRGGKAGFVKIENDTTLIWPDYAGNHHFNTLGNLVVNPRCGLLFPDFASGDLLYLSGTAETIWDGPIVAGFDGAERMTRFRFDQAIFARQAMPLSWTLTERSPFLSKTGAWQ